MSEQKYFAMMSECAMAWFKRARAIKRSLGTRAAAGFLRNRGCSIDTTLWILCRQCRVKKC